MKCISLWEPWGSLMAMGLKTIETRSWATNHRGPLAIASSKKWSGNQRDVLRSFDDQAHTPTEERILKTLGCILCVVNVYDMRPTEVILATGIPALGYNNDGLESLEYGNFGAGRFGWMTKDLRRLKKPIPIVGRQGLFNVPLIECDLCSSTGTPGRDPYDTMMICPACDGNVIHLDLSSVELKETELPF